MKSFTQFTESVKATDVAKFINSLGDFFAKKSGKDVLVNETAIDEDSIDGVLKDWNKGGMLFKDIKFSTGATVKVKSHKFDSSKKTHNLQIILQVK